MWGNAYGGCPLLILHAKHLTLRFAGAGEGDGGRRHPANEIQSKRLTDLRPSELCATGSTPCSN